MSKSMHAPKKAAPNPTAKRKDPLDVHVGRRLRRRRILAGMSQMQLGEAVGVSFQQVQKYECGLNRAVPRRLHEFGRTLGVPLSYFFDGYVERRKGRGESPKGTRSPDVFSTDEAVTLVRAYYNLRTPALRQRIHKLLDVLSQG
jgi:transcriptional regulator with XRE-family HTH domain